MMKARRRMYPVLVEPEELLNISSKDVVLIDVRKEEDYIHGHIPDAVSLPLARVLESMDPKQLHRLFRSVGVDDASKYAIVYDDTFGALAARVAWALEYIGHERVSLLSITYGRWVSLGYAVEKGRGKGKGIEQISTVDDNDDTGIDISADYDILATYDYIQAIIEGIKQLQQGKETNINSSSSSNSSIKKGDGDGKVLLDVRERLNYLDHHIPYAMNIPWKAFAGEDRILKSVDEINSLLSYRKISRSDEVIVYCGSVGTLSGLSYYALRLAGYTRVRLYARSLKEWRSLNLPVEGFKNAHYWDLSAE
ncbi:Thiosulfate sulfurtransferase [archaeon HR04]|nr:Thiosulfate sulfurtransferase [archaeon HR04]